MLTDLDRQNLKRWLAGRTMLELALVAELLAGACAPHSRAAENFTRRAAAALAQDAFALLKPRAHR